LRRIKKNFREIKEILKNFKCFVKKVRKIYKTLHKPTRKPKKIIKSSPKTPKSLHKPLASLHQLATKPSNSDLLHPENEDFVLEIEEKQIERGAKSGQKANFVPVQV
jgi:hypothetical protein